ncbi:hypothetical protein ACM66B_005531 [Microbotryomycetes sp. NB124-2]
MVRVATCVVVASSAWLALAVQIDNGAPAAAIALLGGVQKSVASVHDNASFIVTGTTSNITDHELGSISNAENCVPSRDCRAGVEPAVTAVPTARAILGRLPEACDGENCTAGEDLGHALRKRAATTTRRTSSSTKTTTKPKTSTSSRKTSSTRKAASTTSKRTSTSTKKVATSSQPKTTSTKKASATTKKTSSTTKKLTSTVKPTTASRTTTKKTSSSTSKRASSSTTSKRSSTTSKRTSSTSKRTSTTSQRTSTTSQRTSTTSKRTSSTSLRTTTASPAPVKTSTSTRKSTTTRSTTTSKITTSSTTTSSKSSTTIKATTSTTTSRVTTTTSATSVTSSSAQTSSAASLTSSGGASTTSDAASSTSSTQSALSESPTPTTATDPSSTSDASISTTSDSGSSSGTTTASTPVFTGINITDSSSVPTSTSAAVSNSASSASSGVPPAPTPTCPSPPPSFNSTADGFLSLCSTRYCDPATARDVSFSGLTGPVTRIEIETSLGLLMTQAPVIGLFQGNILANGAFGMAIQSAGLLYETTGDRRALEIALQLAENIYAIRNNPVTGQVLWDGVREPVWPTKADYPNYAGCENGLIVANMVQPAIYILKSPCLWDLVPNRVGNLSYPRAFNNNMTFKDRALALVAAGDLAFQQYFLPWFFDKTGNLIQPNDTRWNTVGDAGSTNLPGMPMPWNRRMMMTDGMLKLAIAFETGPALNLARRNKYDRLVGINIYSFLADVESVTAPNGLQAYDWDYTLNRNNTEEVKGIHALYDVLGVWQAWQRSITLYPIADDVMQRLANTMMYIVFQGPRLFSAFIDGTSTTADPAVKYLWGQWVYYGKWIPNWYNEVAFANRANGFGGKSWFSVPLIWTRNRLTDVSLSWKGDFASGFGFVAGTA